MARSLGISRHSAYRLVSLDFSNRGKEASFARRPGALRCRSGVAKGHMGGTSPTP